MGSLGSNTAEASVVDVPVLVVGGGPAGLLLAYLLSKLDVPSLVIEKYPERLAAPKAHALSPRSLEICRQFGLDTRALRSIGTPRDDACWVNFVTNLSGERIGFLPYERMDAGVLDDTPEMLHNIPQPDFEQFVATELSQIPSVEIRKGVAFVSCQQTDAGVVTTVEERSSGRRHEVRSSYVVGCDGAKSAVREDLGIDCEGEDSYETMMTIHFRADIRDVVGARLGMLHWILDPEVSGFIIAYDLSDNLVLIHEFDPEKHPVSTWNDALCRNVLSAAIGQDIPTEVLSWRPWVLSRKVAKQYRKGNVFLAGDAAHSFPPTGGLGLNTGIADVHNIAHKIAATHHGWAGAALLDSYGAERRHVAEVCAKQSSKNGVQIFSFLKMLGTADAADVHEARAKLMSAIHDPGRRVEISKGVEAQREHFDNLELHIGYVYGRQEVPPHASHYRPKFCAGARLPHAFVSFPGTMKRPRLAALDVSYIKEFSDAECAERQYSTLDLCAPDAFTLLVGRREGEGHRGEALRQQLAEYGVRLDVYVVGVDVALVHQKHKNLFESETGLSGGGGLLVRPDQHILLRLLPTVSDEQARAQVLTYLGLNVI
ncbi:hypothetical protein LTR08_005439 [Meristemomyces frigidus]|nr:hypothetical protein LTR08_005439 [Meristemomyces frigidus]